MRYSHGLRRYHSRKHKNLSIFITLSSFIAVAVLILFFTDNALELFTGLMSSTYRVTVAYFVTLPLSLAIVILVSRSRKTEEFFIPILDVAQSFPSFAILPLLLATVGKDTSSIVLFLIITMIWPIIFTVLSSVKTTREELTEAADIFNARGIKRFISFTLPAIFPGIITGSIVGWGESWEAIVGAELIAGKNGIGAFISNAYDSGNNHLFAISILILLLFIFILNRLIWLPLLKRSTMYQTE